MSTANLQYDTYEYPLSVENKNIVWNISNLFFWNHLQQS